MFDLEPHDIAWDENAAHCQVITPAIHRGQNWRVGVESEYEKGARFLFQREGGPLLTGIHREDQFRPTGLSFSKARDPSSLRMAFADCWNNNKWGRTLFLNENVELRKSGERARFQVVLSSSGFGSWRVLRSTEPPIVEIDPSHRYGEFFWSRQSEPNFLLSDASTIGALLKVQWNNPDSDLSFARRFVQMSAKEQHEQVWSWKHGDLIEMIRVMRWAFLAQEEVWSTPDELQWIVALSRRPNPGFNGEVFFSPKLLKDFPSPEPLKEALRLAFEWFSPTPRTEIIERHLSLKRYFLMGYHQIEIEACQPSAHERLEAALQWRDWLESTRAKG